jgi:hypothetical protein
MSTRYGKPVLRASLIGVLTLSGASASAQWAPHESYRVPKTKAGEPNLRAPAPRTADGKPDLSGVWENGSPTRSPGSISGTGGAPALNGAPPGPLTQFFDIASKLPEGLPLQPWAAELKKKRMAEGAKDNPDAACLPMGNLQFHTHPQPRKIIQTAKVVVILYEGNAGIRQLFTDGRRLPTDDPQPWWYGYSVGRWEKDTLVVETTGFRDDGWLDVNGSPLTSAGRMIERFRRPNFGTLEIEVTVDDPKAYTKPWTVTLTQQIMPDADLIEFVCNENEKSTKFFDK